MTDVVKKRGRPKKDSTDTKPNRLPKTKEAADNVKKNQFKKGESGNKSGWTFRKPTREFREQCHKLIMDHGMTGMLSLFNHCVNNGNARDGLEIAQWLASMAYGSPKPMVETEDVSEESKTNKLPVIVIEKDAQVRITQTDADYE